MELTAVKADRETLRKFCFALTKWGIDEPAVYRGWVYGCNTHVIARMPAEGPDTLDRERGDAYEWLFSLFPSASTMKLVPPLDPSIAERLCAVCDVATIEPPEKDDEGECVKCGGLGITSHEDEHIYERIEGQKMYVRFTSLIRRLAGLKVKQVNKATGPALAFVFDGGGQGILMSCWGN